MFYKSVLAALFAASTFLSVPAVQTAAAGQRYATPPPIVLSPDLTSPWVLQLKGAPKARKALKRKALKSRAKRKASRQKRKFRATTNEARSGVTKRRITSLKPKRKKKSRNFNQKYLPQQVSYSSSYSPGTIIIDTNKKFLYLVTKHGSARRYGVGVGKRGFEWSGTEKISRKASWPAWRPPASMIARERKKGRNLPAYMPGGPNNPLGARALYLGSTLYRIHGTTQPWTIGRAMSSGCIRMRNQDVVDLYERVGVGTKVVVL